MLHISCDVGGKIAVEGNSEYAGKNPDELHGGHGDTGPLCRDECGDYRRVGGVLARLSDFNAV